MQSIVDASAPRGKVVIATKNYLPGELVLEEKPIMVVPNDLVQKCSIPGWPLDLSCLFACYCWFKKYLGAADRERVLQLPRPETCKEADRVRRFADDVILTKPDDSSIKYPMTPEDKELYVLVATNMTRHVFQMRGDQILFAELSSFAHSCASNCHYVIEIGQTTARCTATRHIQAGEEMTISYMPMMDLKSTPERRKFLIDHFEFTCHCPRCDAPGDDTRQFDCFDPACNGVMMVCQPINQEELFLQDLSYSGVEYAEPHLLPCTECHRAAPPEYQARMLTLDVQLPSLVAEYIRAGDAVGLPGLWERIQGQKLPLRHSLCLPLHKVMLRNARWRAFCDISINVFDEAGREECRASVHRIADAYVSAQQGAISAPHIALSEALREVCHECIFFRRDDRFPPLFHPAEAKMWLQRALCTHLMFLGRETGRKFGMCDELHEYLLKALEKLPVPQQVCDMQVCAFCEESPASASMKRSRCGACKKVMYCSAGCQKAHWKLHKKTSRNAPPQA